MARTFLIAAVVVFGMALFAAPSRALAQSSITQVLVHVGGVLYCDVF